jgi:SNF2 family DNA or RNA helicase
MPMIDRFHNDPSVYIFLISTLAGGTGLNLTGANKVIIFGESSIFLLVFATW